MSIFSHLKRCKQIHLLIQRGSAENPTLLAKRLSISVSYVYIYLNALKEHGAHIVYCRKRKRYFYEDSDFKWEDKE
jgi:predicted transcriptional regulator